MAARWGIGDDQEREIAIRQASNKELEALIQCIDGVSDEALYGWLSGSESFSKSPSEEYLAFTCLTMAIDSAKLKLARPIEADSQP